MKHKKTYLNFKSYSLILDDYNWHIRSTALRSLSKLIVLQTDVLTWAGRKCAITNYHVTFNFYAILRKMIAFKVKANQIYVSLNCHMFVPWNILSTCIFYIKLIWNTIRTCLIKSDYHIYTTALVYICWLRERNCV